MTAKQQINAIYNAVHVLRALANETPVGATDNEIAVICAAEVAAQKLGGRLMRHLVMEAVPEEAWDAIPIEHRVDDMADYEDVKV